MGLFVGLSCQNKMDILDEERIKQSCLEQMEKCADESPIGPQLPNDEEKKQIALRSQAMFDTEDDDYFQEQDYIVEDEENYMRWLCEEDNHEPVGDNHEPVTPDKTDACEDPAATPGSLAASDNTPSVATVETPTQTGPSSSPEAILPVRAEIRPNQKEAATKEAPKFMDIPLGPPPNKTRLRVKTGKTVAWARELDVAEDESFVNVTNAEFSKWVHSKKNRSNEIQLKKLYKLGYNMVRFNYIKERNRKMDPKEKKKRGHYKARLSLAADFTKMSFDDRKEQAFKLYRDLTSSKEKFAVALAYGYGPKVVFNTEPNEGEVVEEEEDKSSNKKFLDASFGMFTYYHKAWTLQRSAWGELDDIGRFEKLCKEDSYVLSLWDKLTEEFLEKSMKLQVAKFAYSFELCPKHFKNGELVLHFTVVFLFNEKKQWRTSRPMALKDGTVPQHVQDPSASGKNRRGNNPNPMFYYVQMPKFGMVLNDSNWKPYEQFQVNDKWLIPFLQAKKIDCERASQDHFLPFTLASWSPPKM